jgi:cytochrome c5
LANVEQWAPRLEKGMETLYASGINGLAPAMPARGMCFDCSDDDIRAVVDYMTASVQ